MTSVAKKPAAAASSGRRATCPLRRASSRRLGVGFSVRSLAIEQHHCPRSIVHYPLFVRKPSALLKVNGQWIVDNGQFTSPLSLCPKHRGLRRARNGLRRAGSKVTRPPAI